MAEPTNPMAALMALDVWLAQASTYTPAQWDEVVRQVAADGAAKSILGLPARSSSPGSSLRVAPPATAKV
jgi:hypothetical protein